MTTTIPKWNDERTAQLEAAVGNEDPVTKATVARIADELGTSARSVSSKLRKLEYNVEKASEATKAFDYSETAELREFVEANDGMFTYAEIAAQFAGGKFSAKSIQGKILSMELNDLVKPTPKPETVKLYSDAEEAIILDAIHSGAFVEEIAEKVGRTVSSVRGKALSFLRAKQIDAMPKQREVKGQAPDAFEALGDVSGMTVAQIAEALEKTERGVKTMLTRRAVKAADYDGAAKAEKAAK